MVVFKSSCFYVKRDRPLVIRDTHTETEQVGYVTIGQLVTGMMMSGERLQSFKRQAYDYPDGVYDLDDVCPDPTLDVGFDLADASYYESKIASRIKAAKFKKEKEVVQEEKETSVSSSPSPDDDAA